MVGECENSSDVELLRYDSCSDRVVSTDVRTVFVGFTMDCRSVLSWSEEIVTTMMATRRM